MIGALRILLLLSLLLSSAAAPTGAAAGTEEDVLMQARAHIEAGRGRVAADMLASYSPSDEEFALYHYLLAGTLGSDPIGATEHLRWAIMYAPDDTIRSDAHLARAEIFLAMQYYNEAVSDYGKFIDEGSGPARLAGARVGLARALRGAGRPQEALRQFGLAGTVAEAAFGRADTLHDTGKYEEAYRAYVKAMRRYPDFITNSEESLYRFGEVLRNLGRPEEARRYLHAVRHTQYKYRAQLSLGLVEMAAGRDDEAREFFQVVAQSGPKEPRGKAVYYLARTNMRAGRNKEAIEGFNTVRSQHPYTSWYDGALLGLARIYRATDRPQQAVPLLKELVFRPTPLSEALEELELIVIAELDVEGERFLRLWQDVGSWLFDATREDTLVLVAARLKRSGEPSMRINNWLSKHATPRIRSRSLVRVIGYLARSGEADAARDYVKKYAPMTLTHDDLRRAEAVVLISASEPKEAVAKMLRIKEPDAEDLTMLAAIAPGTGHEVHVAALMGRNPDVLDRSPVLHARLADMLYALGRRKAAAKHYDIALQKGVGSHWVMYRAGTLSGTEKAEKLFKELGRGASAESRMARAGLRAFKLEQKIAGMF